MPHPRRFVGILCLTPLEDRFAPALLGNQLFPADSPWNQKITNAPVAGTSAGIIANIIANQGGDGRLHPDFGQASTTSSGPLYGIPYNVVHGNSVGKVAVVIDAYPDESDIVSVPLPSGWVRIEGDFQNGPNPTIGYGTGGRGDSHLIVYDVDNNDVYELFNASRPTENGDGKWHADGQAVWDLDANTFRTLGWTSADAAGLPILTGLVRPDELAAGVITHPIRVTLRNAVILNQYLFPASHTANAGNNNPATQPPMGARFRLKSSVNISGLDPQSRIVAQAMKDYGLIVADNGSNFFFTGASYSVDANNAVTATWNDADIQSTTKGLKSLRFSDFEVVDLTPVVTGVSANFGPPAGGNTVTITGQNFSGAAGNLHVLFGAVEATGVTIVSDSQLTVTVPAQAAGTVDVRVRSGSTKLDADGNAVFFGYGTSAVTPADRYNYGTTAPLPPPPGGGGGGGGVGGSVVPLIAAGADAGGGGVKVYNADGSLRFALDPFPGFTGGVRVAVADVTGDGVDDIIAGTGPGGPPRVAVFDGATQARLAEFLAFEATFTGGTYVAAGDFDRDGKAEVVVTPDQGGGPVVAVFRVANGAAAEVVRFLGIQDDAFRGGARAAVGDVTGDGVPDLVVSAGFLGGPRVSVWDGAAVAGGTKPATPLANFFAFEQTLRNGNFVAVGDVTGDGKADLILGGGPGGGPRVRVADAAKLLAAGDFGSLDAAGRGNLTVANFFAGSDSLRGGVRVAAANLDGDAVADVVTGSGEADGSRVRGFAGKTVTTTPAELFGFDGFPGFAGGVFVG